MQSSHRLLIALGILTAFLGGGCAQIVSYSPDDGVIGRSGMETARGDLERIISSATQPAVTRVEATETFYAYDYQQTIHGAYGIPMGSTPGKRQIFYANIQRLEIYDNNFVFVYAGGQVDKILFNDPESARSFADHVSSFRANKLTKK